MDAPFGKDLTKYSKSANWNLSEQHGRELKALHPLPELDDLGDLDQLTNIF